MNTVLLFTVAALVSTAWAANNGPVQITVDGSRISKYVLSSEESKGNIRVSGDTITLSGGGRAYLGDSSSETISPDSFYEMPFLGKRFSVTMDLNEVGCNCNGAVYTVGMPGYNSGQQPEPGKDGSYYCDANQVGGTYCPEMDISEANKFAMASTAHTCNYVAPHYYSSCDRGGCGTNVLDQHLNDFGPGKTIDTDQSFTLSVSFEEGGPDECGVPSTLTRVTNVFSQNGKEITFDACNPDYLQWMGCSLPGMVLTMSLWGTGEGGMSWLDGKSGCHGGCNLDASKVTFSNITLTTL